MLHWACTNFSTPCSVVFSSTAAPSCIHHPIFKSLTDLQAAKGGCCSTVGEAGGAAVAGTGAAVPAAAGGRGPHLPAHPGIRTQALRSFRQVRSARSTAHLLLFAPMHQLAPIPVMQLSSRSTCIFVSALPKGSADGSACRRCLQA